MSIANIFNNSETPLELAQWSTLHMILHRNLNLAVLHQHNILLPEFVLDPFDPLAPGVWLLNHQTMHDNIDNIIGLPSYNLLDLNWADPEARQDWLDTHALQMQQETNVLGVYS